MDSSGKIMNRVWCLLVSALLAVALFAESGCGGKNLVNPPPISAELQSELEVWLSEHGLSPSSYVVGLFEKHDVVLLGEQHRFKHDLLFVQELIPILHANGVNVLATEFARREDQDLLDSLVTSPEWDEELGRDLLFRNFMPWGYREYVDVFKAAWQVNRNLAPGTPAFRILGVNNARDYSHFNAESDWNDPEVLKLVDGDQTESDWALPVLAAVEAAEKVAAHCGINHAFTGYRQRRVESGAFAGEGRFRFGNRLREALEEDAITVYLHAPWNSASGYGTEFVHPADGRLDAFMFARSEGPFQVGFNVADSPLADLPIENAVYKHGHEPFTLSDFCDG